MSLVRSGVVQPDDELRLSEMWYVELPLSEGQYKLLVRAAQTAGQTSVDDWIRSVLVTEAKRILEPTESPR